MAEGSSSSDCTEATSPGAQPLDGLSLDMISGQSKSESEEFVQFAEVENPKEGKNRLLLVCKHCKCKVMGGGYGTLVENEVFLFYPANVFGSFEIFLVWEMGSLIVAREREMVIPPLQQRTGCLRSTLNVLFILRGMTNLNP